MRGVSGDTKEEPMKREVNGFSVVELMVVVTVIAIILAVAVPFYISYKRTSCDRAAQSDLAALQSAVYKYVTDPANINRELPRNIQDVAGDYYGWGGTNRKCGVKVYFHPTSQSICAVASRGSRPTGPESRYRYCYRIHGLASNWLERIPAIVWSWITDILEPSSAHAFMPDLESPPDVSVAGGDDLRNYVSVSPDQGCRGSAFSSDGKYVGCSEQAGTGEDNSGVKPVQAPPKYAFDSDFNDMKNLEPVYGSTKSSWSIEDGRLVGRRSRRGEQNIAFGDESWTDCEIEVSATIMKKTTKKGTKQSPGYGIYYRATDEDGNGRYTGYRFQYDPCLRKFVIRKVYDGREKKPFQSVRIKKFIPKGDVYNKKHTVNISVRSDHHVVKVDGKKVLEFKDNTFPNGRSGLRTWANSGKWSESVVKFDRARVRTGS